MLFIRLSLEWHRLVACEGISYGRLETYHSSGSSSSASFSPVLRSSKFAILKKLFVLGFIFDWFRFKGAWPKILGPRVT